MLRRENIGGIYYLQPMSANLWPCMRVPEALVQMQAFKAASPEDTRSLNSSEIMPVLSGKGSSSIRSRLRHPDCDGLAAKRSERKRYTGPTESEMRRSLSRIEVWKAEAIKLCAERKILDRILSPSYTTDLPSQATRSGFDDFQFNSIEDDADELRNYDPTPPPPDPASVLKSQCDFADEVADSDMEEPLPSSIRIVNGNTVQPNSLLDENEPRGYQTEVGIDRNDDNDGFDEFEDDENLDLATLANIQQNTSLDMEQHIPGINDEDYSVANEGIADSSQNPTDMHTAVSPKADTADANAVQSEILPTLHCLAKLGSEEPLVDVPPDRDPMEEPLPGGTLQVIEYGQQEATIPTEETQQVPTAEHYQALKRLPPNERISLINDFMEQNVARINNFLARRQVFPAVLEPDARTIETIFSHHWDNAVELQFLTEAVNWLDTLLIPFRTAILSEDLSSVKPRIEQAVRDFDATYIPSIADTGATVSAADAIISKQFSDRLMSIQTSNSTRRQLLEHINIEISTFENLLLSAENIRYRRDLGREYGQRDDLVDGLRRIYSTITCTIPVGLSEDDWIEQPPEPHKITYGTGPFYPYGLPGRPQIFDHHSISHTETSRQGCTSLQMNEHQTPLSQEYWRNLHRELRDAIAAQRLDEAGSVKLRKHPDSMDRDWDAFYTPIYGTGMANYAAAAAQRIEDEMNEVTLVESRAQHQIEEAEEVQVSNSHEIVAEIQHEESRRSSEDITDSSDTTNKLEIGNQDVKRRIPFCVRVNQQGGCLVKSSCGAESHDNQGKHCKWGERCKFGAGRCAYIHDEIPDNGSIRSSSVQPRSSIASANPRTRDLRPILDQVLVNPKSFRVCTFVNKPQGCKSGELCAFNHTLEGVMCEDYQRDECPRAFECPLKHPRRFNSIAGFINSPTTPNHIIEETNRSQDNASPLRLITEGFGSHRQRLDTHNYEQDYRHPPDSKIFSQLANMDTQLLDPMDYEQSPEDRGLPPNTPTGPRKRYAQQPRVYSALSTLNADQQIYRDQRRLRILRHKEPYYRNEASARPLVDRITRDGPAQEQQYDEDEYESSDYSGDDEFDQPETRQVQRPRKKRKKAKTRHDGSRQHGRRG